ncbi:MAG: hypothetical protein V1913_00605, partial [Fibrobacterota bacterium]
MVRILSVSLTEDGPYIIVEKRDNAFSIVKKGALAQEKELPFKGINYTVCEFKGARFLYDDRFSGMDAA